MKNLFFFARHVLAFPSIRLYFNNKTIALRDSTYSYGVANHYLYLKGVNTF